MAELYGISESSVKRLIRQHGASKPCRALSQHLCVRDASVRVVPVLVQASGGREASTADLPRSVS
jgi:hypothetical protein